MTKYLPSDLQKTLKALADPTRREILDILKEGKKSAGDISEKFSISAAAISRHLSILKEADLVRDQREGKFIFYEANLSIMQDLLSWFSGFKEKKSIPAPQPKISKPVDSPVNPNAQA